MSSYTGVGRVEAEVLQRMVQTGVITADEFRERMGLSPLETEAVLSPHREFEEYLGHAINTAFAIPPSVLSSGSPNRDSAVRALENMNPLPRWNAAPIMTEAEAASMSSVPSRAEFESISCMLEIGAITPNEARARMGLPSIESEMAQIVTVNERLRIGFEGLVSAMMQNPLLPLPEVEPDPAPSQVYGRRIIRPQEKSPSCHPQEQTT